MAEWEEWHGVEDSDFPCIRRLWISYCPKLRRIPAISSLDTLSIMSCPELERLPSLPSLAKLTLRKELNPEVLSGCRLPLLRRLSIHLYSGDSLNLPDKRSLPSLKKLVFAGSASLRSVSGLGGLVPLRHLNIFNCRQLPGVVVCSDHHQRDWKSEDADDEHGI